MLENKFKDKTAFEIYITEQKVRMENGYLTRSEREQLKQMLAKDYNPTFVEEKIKKGLSIITNINLLRKPCQIVKDGENISKIVQDLKNTLEEVRGFGLSANQIGYDKKISYIKIFKNIDQKTKKINYNEYILINPKIIEKNKPSRIVKEGCTSFPNMYVDTLRYIFCTVNYLDENFKECTGVFADMESICAQHEIAHLNGRTIFDDKWFLKRKDK